jgi:BolA family transcriptional regulator, general stress-responsive regulator
MSEERPVAKALRTKLEAAFSPSILVIEDESSRHAGHVGARPEGETHFSVRIVSDAFAEMSRVERQRKIYAAVADELATRVHALSLVALTSDEAKRQSSAG